MKKIILPFEGECYYQELLEFARMINESEPVTVTAAFLPEVDYANLWTAAGGVATAVYVPPPVDEDEVVRKNGARFREFCKENGIACLVHEDRYDFALPSLKKETRFADLLAISSSHFFQIVNDKQPNAYMKEILHMSECPVMLVPEAIYKPGRLILAYDGTPASSYAIRQFAYLFPGLCQTSAVLIYLAEHKDEPLPDQELIEELVSRHYSNLEILKMHLNPEDFFDKWIPAQRNPWLISGSFGRSEISALFSKSFVMRAIKAHRLPLFIAHR